MPTATKQTAGKFARRNAQGNRQGMARRKSRGRIARGAMHFNEGYHQKKKSRRRRDAASHAAAARLAFAYNSVARQTGAGWGGRRLRRASFSILITSLIGEIIKRGVCLTRLEGVSTV